jgi:GH35 family endo-1,4-beta-xylanase
MSFVVRQTQLLQRRGTTPAPENPQITADPLTINEDVNGEIAIVYNPANPNPVNWASLNVTVLSGNITANANKDASGSVSNSKIQIIPDAQWNGAASIEVTVEDDEANESDPLTVNITVNSVSDNPVLQNESLTINEDASGVITLNFSDAADGDTVVWASLEVVTHPAHGVVQLNTPGNGQITYSGAANNHTDVTFTVRVQDSTGAWSNTATMSVTIDPLADAPVLTSPIAFNFNEDVNGTLDIDASYFSADGTARRTTSGSIVCSTPTYGALDINQSTGVITYTANDPNWHGSDSFTVYVFDANNLQSNTATVNVTVSAVNDAPAAYDYTVDTIENNAIVFSLEDLNLALDFDDTIDWATAEVVDEATYGDVSITDGVVTYFPNANNQNDDSFTWRVQDDAGAWSNVATVYISVLESPILQALKALGAHAVYALNELSGGSFADSSGNANDAGAINGSGITYNAGTPASSQRGTGMDGSPQIQITDATTYINITDTSVKGAFGGSNFSVLIIVQEPDGTWSDAAQRQFFQVRENTGNEFHSIQVLTSGVVQWLSTINAEADSAQLGSAQTGTDHHVFATSFDDAANTLYYFRDATQEATDTNSQTPALDVPNTNVRIGNAATSAAEIRLSYFSVFTTTLTAAQVASVYNAWAQRYNYQSLRQLAAAKGCHVGVAVPNEYASKSSTYRNTVEADFSIMSTENACKYSTLYWAGLNSPNWDELEEIILAADARGIRHALHPLFWHADNAYIDNEIADTEVAAKAEITRRIVELRNKYDAEGWSEPFLIDVCNEIIVTDSSEASAGRPLRQDNQWTAKFNNNSSAVGTQASARAWIDYCFIETRKYFPNSLLVLADYRNDKAGYWKGDAFYNLVEDMVNDGIPIDGVHFQGHWEHYTGGAKYLYDSTVITQINKFKALTNYRGKAMYVGWSELDVRLSPYTPNTAISPLTVSSSSTGSTLDMPQNIFDSAMPGIYKVYNLTDGTSRNISGYTDGNTVTVDSAINDTWDGDVVYLSIEVMGTVSASSSGTSLIATASVFDADMVGYSVMNLNTGDVAEITAYTSATQVTLSKSIGDTWDGHTFYIGQDALLYNVMKNTAALVDYIGFWNVKRDESWHGTHNNCTLRAEDLSKLSAWNYVARGIYNAS